MNPKKADVQYLTITFFTAGHFCRNGQFGCGSSSTPNMGWCSLDPKHNNMTGIYIYIYILYIYNVYIYIYYLFYIHSIFIIFLLYIYLHILKKKTYRCLEY